MLYEDAIRFLYGLQLFGAKLGLENTRKLAELAGSPQERLRFIHVAGTNGKGSTCAMLESVYRAAGLRVGLFTSPHLVSFRERIQVNRELISETEVIREVEALQRMLIEFSRENHPTFFEVVTVMALRYFAARECELVVWETGLGGRLDATNIVTPLASVITNVELDHEKWLGHTIAEIAAEKAGIIKPGVPVVTGAEEPALSIVSKNARANRSALRVVTEPLADVELSLAGEHQRLNAALAVETVRVLQNRIAVSETAMRDGLMRVSWAGRLQVIRRGPQTILLDGAHNPAGARALRAAIDANYSRVRLTLLLGVMRDKDGPAICEILAPVAKRIIACRVASERSADPRRLAELCRAVNPRAQVSSVDSIEAALQQAASDPFVAITGSLHFIGHALDLLCPTGHPNERALNEWTAGRG